MTDFLAQMGEASAQRAERAREHEDELRARIADARPALKLDTSQFGLIAELKPASPSEGEFADPLDVADRARGYAEGGAVAISVLTEPDRFQGNLELLERVATKVELPVMRKDFLVDPVQLLEARAAGASGVLLIAELLDDQQLTTMLETAKDLGMFVLLESFSMPETQRALLHCDGQRVVAGVNCRDLRDLSVDLERFDIAGRALQATIWVAESGIRNVEELERVAATGCRLALCGTILMRSGDPAEVVREFTERGRRQS